MTDFSDYIVYVDESGDHGLKTVDTNYPMFVRAFCIFKKSDYIGQLTPALQGFKFNHFGHDQVILHETDIRKDQKEFSFLNNRERKANFLNALTQIVASVPVYLDLFDYSQGTIPPLVCQPRKPLPRGAGIWT